MSNAAEALKKALEHEKKALDHYKEVIAHATHKETKEVVEKIASEKSQQIDSLHWMIMAEAGQIEADSSPAEKEGEPKPATASKCPFSGALADMGIDITKMGEMAEGDLSKMGDMAKMMGMDPSKEKPKS